jgi:hypothetical protein
MSKRRRVRFADPTARIALNRVMRGVQHELRRKGYELTAYEVRYCSDPTCVQH